MYKFYYYKNKILVQYINTVHSKMSDSRIKLNAKLMQV